MGILKINKNDICFLNSQTKRALEIAKRYGKRLDMDDCVLDRDFLRRA
jgi:hypothetical protein